MSHHDPESLKLGPYEELGLKDSSDLERFPSLHLEDVSEIPFLDDIPGVELYQHRARVRAKEGDVFAAVTSVAEGYEDYCRDLDLGHVDFTQVAPAQGLLAVAHALSADCSSLVRRAKEAGGFIVHPYMSIEPVWSLAKKIQAQARVEVSVVGSPPPVTWLANDKASFTQMVDDVLGPEWVVETKMSRLPEEITTNLAELAGRHERVGLKRTRCASAMGNRVFRGSQVRGTAAQAAVQDFLRDKQWQGDEPVLAVEWVDDEGSPSTQLWLPPLGEGAPIVDGVYDQILEGPERMFVGSRPSLLPTDLQQKLSDGSLKVAERLQALGYVGRCSFDFVLARREGTLTPMFTESNARWGGTSTPMHLVDRLYPGAVADRPAYRAQDFVYPELLGWSFERLRRTLAEGLFDPGSGRGNFILYNVGPLAGSGKFDVVAVGESAEHADELVETELPQRLGLD